ncbi:MAG TPA: carboxylesterase/lipase family protein [Acidimicrobiales bacterium]|nr:carboxylesterase/lipase family protein [Acidimicrobiales bacterium]
MTTATTTTGSVQGLEKDGVHQFRGIPYARAERFRPPGLVEPWSGVREATEFGPMCPQKPGPLEAMLGGREGLSSEDALVLNVYTPAIDDGARPVMVWIHGGGFVSGSGHIPWYDGTNLVRASDVVVVTINYRLGALGFLDLGHIDPALAGSGANGIRDQIAALRWVRDNIAGFGGDPGNVTIFGESAGAMSVGTLLGIPEAAGLFHRAIAESGAASNVQTLEVAEWVTDRMLAEAGLSPASADGLLAMPVDEVLRIQGIVETAVLQGDGPGVHAAGGVLCFQPVVDGTVLERPPLDAVEAGNAAGVPVTVGTTADEWNLFHIGVRQTGSLDEGRVRRRIGRVLGDDHVDAVLDAYRAARPGADLDGIVCAIMTDRVFRMPAIRLAEAQLAHAPRVSMYRFDLASTTFGGLLGACHAIEIPFAFGNLDRRGVDLFIGGLDDDMHRLSERCVRAWTGMARTGDPEHDELRWPAYDADRRATCVLDRTPTVVDDPEGQLRELWDEVGGTRP